LCESSTASGPANPLTMSETSSLHAPATVNDEAELAAAIVAPLRYERRVHVLGVGVPLLRLLADISTATR